jgi:putative inorganic carbon (hco3(-)) transporter
MRDMLLLVLLSAGCLWSIRAPWIGAIMWTVVSLGSPHVAFGYAAANWPVSMVVGGSTLLGLVLTRERQNPFSNLAVVLTALLMVWMTITLPFSLAPEFCYDTWDRTAKIMVMLFVTISLLDTKKKLEVFIWANVISVGYFGVKGGVFSIVTGGNHIVLGPGGFIAENNALALAEILILPLMRYLQLQMQNKWARRAMGVSMALVAVAVLASHSRGGLLGLIAISGFFWLRSGNKFRWAAIIVLASILALTAMPDEYWQRMSTIKTYEEDASAQGRINSWWVAYNVANDRITGGGYRLNVNWIFAKYAPNPRMLFVAHSIYFQMLGEQGYIGLLLFLSIGVMTWINCMRMIRRGKQDPELRWAADLGAMVQVSMVGYAVAGAFLSLALFDLPYNVMAISALGLRFATLKSDPQPELVGTVGFPVARGVRFDRPRT